jgi:hypothetical protein
MKTMSKSFACLLLAMITLASGCALIKKFQDMSPKQKVLWFMSTYNAEYQELQLQARCYNHDHTTDAQRAVMQWKKQLLKEAHTLISRYLEAVEAGTPPAGGLGERILALMNQILSAEATGAPAGGAA